MASTPSTPFRIIIEGNIGSGKSTFLGLFSQRSSRFFLDNNNQNPSPVLILPEPLEQWRNAAGSGINLFQLLADSPKRWSFTFQSYVQLTMLRHHQNQGTPGTRLKIMERSLYSGRYCFIEHYRDSGILTQFEFQILNEWFSQVQPPAPVDLLIYLKCHPSVIFERIRRRGRQEEAWITLEYLEALHEVHENWLTKEMFPIPAVKVMTIDTDQSLEEGLKVFQEKIDEILGMVQFGTAK